MRIGDWSSDVCSSDLIAHLVDAVDDLEQAADVDELRLAPKAGIDRVRRLGVGGDEAVLLWVPDRVAGLAFDHGGGQRRDQTSPTLVEVGRVSEGQRLQEPCVCRLGRVGSTATPLL